MSFKNIDNVNELNTLIQNNYNDSESHIIRQFEVVDTDILKKIVQSYREDFAFGIKYYGDFYSFYKDRAGHLFGRKAKEFINKPIDRENDICGSYQEVIDELGI